MDLRRKAIPVERQRQVLHELVDKLERSPDEKKFAIQEGAIELLKELQYAPDKVIRDNIFLPLAKD